MTDHARPFNHLPERSSHMTATVAPLTPADLGLDFVLHAPDLDRFPWQLQLVDGRVVLLSADLAQSCVLPSGAEIREPGSPHRVPLPLLPPAVLAAAGQALSRADGNALADLLRRRRQIAQVWEVGDVVAVRPDLSDDQAWAVLREVERTMSADAGITWRTLEDAAAGLFGPAPGAHD